jgi:hypothetical protein
MLVFPLLYVGFLTNSSPNFRFLEIGGGWEGVVCNYIIRVITHYIILIIEFGQYFMKKTQKIVIASWRPVAPSLIAHSGASEAICLSSN